MLTPRNSTSAHTFLIPPPNVQKPFLIGPKLSYPNAAAMGSGKKEAARRERQGVNRDAMKNVKTKGENFYRCVPRPSRVSATRTKLTRLARRQQRQKG